MYFLLILLTFLLLSLLISNSYEIKIFAIHSSKDIIFYYSHDLFNNLNDWYIYCDEYCINNNLYVSSRDCG